MSNPIKTRAVVDSLKAHGEGVYTINLKPEGRVPRFKPGQFLHLSVDEYDPSGGFWPDSRVFSIASAPGKETVSIVYSVKGIYTRKMEERLKAGSRVWLKLPFGDFIIKSSVHEGQSIVLVAGGTGISPFIPYLEGICQDGGLSERKVFLYYGVRTESNVLFPELLARCVSKLDQFIANLWIENQCPEVLSKIGVKPRAGHLSIDAIYWECNGLRDPVYFLSGPPAMISNFRVQLAEKGVSSDNVKSDEWE